MQLKLGGVGALNLFAPSTTFSCGEKKWGDGRVYGPRHVSQQPNSFSAFPTLEKGPRYSQLPLGERENRSPDSHMLHTH